MCAVISTQYQPVMDGH